jgi:hypothetical protein
MICSSDIDCWFMYFTPFEDAVPSIGATETRVLHVFRDCEVPIGSYVFLECYCTDPECDCQLVRFVVVGEDGQKHACISYGWNDKAFYDEAFSACDHNFPGPDFAFLTLQGPYANYFLDFCKNILIRDEAYVERLKRHNILFKQAMRERDLSGYQPIQKSPSLGRNEPCLCGSGKKYKKCCY